jgi:hypothetical protein
MADFTRLTGPSSGFRDPITGEVIGGRAEQLNPVNPADDPLNPALPVGQFGAGTMFDPIQWRPTTGPGRFDPSGFFSSARRGLPYSVGSDWQFQFDPSMSPGAIQGVKDEFWNRYPFRPPAAPSPIRGVLDGLGPLAFMPGGGDDGGGASPPGGGGGATPGGQAPAASPTSDTPTGDTPAVVGEASGAGRSSFEQAIDAAVNGVNSPIGTVGLSALAAGLPGIGTAIAAGAKGLAALGRGFGFGGSHADPSMNMSPEAQTAFAAQRSGERAPISFNRSDEAATGGNPAAGVGPAGSGSGVAGDTGGVGSGQSGPAGAGVAGADSAGPGTGPGEGGPAGDSGAGGPAGDGGDGGPGDGGFRRGGRVPRSTHPRGGKSAWKGAPHFARGGVVSERQARLARIREFERNFGAARV